MAETFDLVVVGAGAAGLAAARSARRAGRSVALVEQNRPGGDCTHFGCVPSKTLLETARRVQHARTGVGYGFQAQVTVDFGAVMNRVRDVIRRIEQDESPALLKRSGIELVPGHARFVAADTVDVEGRRLSARRMVLAVGAGPSVPGVSGIQQAQALTNETVFDLDRAPDHLMVMGGGPIGCELAQAFRRLGCRVTVLEALDRLLTADEPEAGRVVRAVLDAEGVDVRTGAAVAAVSGAPPALRVTLDGGASVTGSHLLVSVGRRARTTDLDLDVAGVECTDRGAIAVDGHLRTSVAHIYAAGDCASPLQFTHVADEQGRIAAGNAFAARWRPAVLGGPRTFDVRVIPWTTFTDPEVGRVGLTESDAFDRYGPSALVAYLPESAQDRARAADETAGFIKLIAAPGRLLPGRPFLRLVGMTAVAPTGGELVAEGALAMRTRMLLGRIAQTVHAYPTWALSTRVAAAMFFGETAGRTARPARAGGAAG